MSDADHRLKRVRRLRTLDEHKITGLSNVLAQLNARIDALNESLQELNAEPLMWKGSSDESSIGMQQHLCSRMQWLQTRADEIASQLSKIELDKNTIIQEIVQQRAKVKAWSNLCDRIEAEIERDRARSESIAADERYLLTKQNEWTK